MTEPTPDTRPSDNLLVEQMADGDRALAELYERYGALAYSLARAIVGNDADAEEVVLDTFLKVWRDADGFDPDRGSVKAWVATIARSRALDRVRSRKRHTSALRRSAATTDTGLAVSLSTQPDAEKNLDRTLAREQLGTWLGHLPKEQKEALELAYFRGYSHSEIAAELGAPLGTVKTRIRTALGSLRDRVQPQLGGGGS